jgi:hypothetical protein
MSLLNALLPFIQKPLSPLGEAAVNAYEMLPGVAGWTPPPNFQPIHAHDILAAGWPLAVLGSRPGLQRLLLKSGSREISPPDLSVIHAGALLTTLGCSVEFPEEKPGRRTADIRASCDGAVVDVEVTAPLQKDPHRELQHIMQVLSKVIGTDTAGWHPLIHLAGIPTDDTQSKIIDAVITLGPGGRVGSLGAWDVYAVPFEQGHALNDAAKLQAFRPVWWDDEGVTLFAASTLLASQPESVRRMQVYAKLPILTYLNSIQSKADRPQREPNNPYLIMIDQSAVRLSHTKLSRELSGLLPLWPQVSGVLCFSQDPCYYRNFCWPMSFHPNPDAERPLPPHIAGLVPHNQEVRVNLFA